MWKPKEQNDHTRPSGSSADDSSGRAKDVLAFVEGHDLMGKGLGYIDVHLLASAALTELPLWTFDKKLAEAADTLLHKHQQKSR